jgi:hypothetical protein
MRNDAKWSEKIVFSFAKTSENEAKQVRFVSFRFEAKIKKERKRDTLGSPDLQEFATARPQNIYIATVMRCVLQASC